MNIVTMFLATFWLPLPLSLLMSLTRSVRLSKTRALNVGNPESGPGPRPISDSDDLTRPLLAGTESESESEPRGCYIRVV